MTVTLRTAAPNSRAFHRRRHVHPFNPDDSKTKASDTPPDASGSDLIDAEIIAGFVAETLELIEASERAALALEAHPDDRDAIDTLFRCFHTTKGTAGFLGLEAIVEFSHAVESLLSEIRAGHRRTTPALTDLLLRCVDALGRSVATLEKDPAVTAAFRPLLVEIAHVLDPTRAQPGTDKTPSEVPEPARAEPSHEQRDADTWIRVRTDRLDRLIEAIGELVVAQSVISREAAAQLDSDSNLAQLIANSGKIVRELQALSVSSRMVPLRSVFQKLQRLVRDLSHKSHKPIDFIMEGEDTEIDRNVVDLVGDPLVHMIRNAVDHGIEKPEERAQRGKPPVARLQLKAYHSAGNIVIELSDDGRGLDRDRIRQRAITAGLLAPAAQPSDTELFRFIFAPGFSTAESISELSGRGVGLDVVRRNLERLRGRIEIDSQPGEGARFRLLLPLTLAITDGMLIRVNGDRYVLPLLNIQETFRPEPGMVKTVSGRGELVTMRGEVLPVVRLAHLLGKPTGPEIRLLVVVAAAERRCALAIDELIGQQQVVSRAMHPALGQVAGVSGAAILGDGRVGLILDVAELIHLARSNGFATALTAN
jgi:two-component system chemotaxis sensor kinase CheA